MSIRLRLTIYWALVLAGILAASALVAFGLFQRQQWGSLDAALLEEADTSAHELALADPPKAALLIRGLSLERDIGPNRRALLATRNGAIADFGNRNAIPPRVPADRGQRGVVDDRTGRFRFAIMPLTFGGEPAILENGVDTAPIRESIDRLRTALLLTVPFVLVLCVAGGYLLAGRALSPIAALENSLAAIQPNDLSRRLPAPEVADEIGRLIGVINSLLDRLEQASVTERRFASDAAHELRTPLAVLRSGLEVALSRDRSARENRTALENASREVVSLCKIAEELLLLARLDGEVGMNLERVDLGELIKEIGVAVEPLASARNIELRCNYGSGIWIDGSGSHLRRLIINLVDNALKFTPSGGKIEVKLRREQHRAVLCVFDSGPGLDPAELPHIFDRFFRGAHANGEGGGLGLSLCREIARIHHGQIVATNRPHGGCEFIVTLPLARPTEARQSFQ